MEQLSYTTFDLIVYVEWESRVNFVTILATYIKINFGAYMYVSIQTIHTSDRMMTSLKCPLKCYLCTYIHK